MTWRAALYLSIIAIGLFAVVGTLYARGDKTPQDYDKDGDGTISYAEARTAAQDYIEGEIAADELLAVQAVQYYALPVQTSGASTATRTPTPAQLPATPRVTKATINTAALSIDWRYSGPKVTHFQIAYRREGDDDWTVVHAAAGSSGMSIGGAYVVGGSYEVWIRAVNRHGPGEWAGIGRFLVVAEPEPTATPTPRPTPQPEPTPLTNAHGLGCWGMEELPSRFRYYGTTSRYRAIADVRLAALFENPPRPAKEPWEAPKPISFSYGFIVRDVADFGLLVLVNEAGRWTVTISGPTVGGYGQLSARNGHEFQDGQVVETHHHSRGYVRYVVSSGSFAEAGIPFRVGPTQNNHLALIVEGNSYRLWVNGHSAPLGIDAHDLEQIEAQIGGLRYHDTGEWTGYYNATYAANGGSARERTGGGMNRWVACVP